MKKPKIVTCVGAKLNEVSFAAMLASPRVDPGARPRLVAPSATGFGLGIEVMLEAHQTTEGGAVQCDGKCGNTNSASSCRTSAAGRRNGFRFIAK